MELLEWRNPENRGYDWEGLALEVGTYFERNPMSSRSKCCSKVGISEVVFREVRQFIQRYLSSPQRALISMPIPGQRLHGYFWSSDPEEIRVYVKTLEPIIEGLFANGIPLTETAIGLTDPSTPAGKRAILQNKSLVTCRDQLTLFNLLLQP